MHKYGKPLGICTCSMGSAYNSFFVTVKPTSIYHSETEFEITMNCNLLLMELIYHVFSPSK